MVDIAVNAKLPSASQKVETPFRRALRRLFRRKSAVVGLAVVVFFIALAVFAPLLSPYDPAAQSWSLVRNEPSLAHWFGTDDL
ncbi:MAG TPA: ABC transporter permease, partial [Pseudolabrys sp.]|nr:ABC transporter permease [Pseudolabrys sp.]